MKTYKSNWIFVVVGLDVYMNVVLLLEVLLLCHIVIVVHVEFPSLSTWL